MIAAPSRGYPTRIAALTFLRTALVEIAALDASNLGLLRRTWRADRLAATATVPYVLWTAFATALTAAIALRNRPAQRYGRR